MKTREIEVFGYFSVLQQLPGVAAEDVIAVRRRRWITQPMRSSTVLIVDRRFSQYRTPADQKRLEQEWAAR